MGTWGHIKQVCACWYMVRIKHILCGYIWRTGVIYVLVKGTYKAHICGYMKHNNVCRYTWGALGIYLWVYTGNRRHIGVGIYEKRKA